MAKITIEDIIKELYKDNWQLVSTEYTNLDTEMEFICDEGHHVYAPWKKLRNKRECPSCKQNYYKNQDKKIIPKRADEYRVLAIDQATKVSGYAIFSNELLIKYGIHNAIDSKNEIERDIDVKQWMISMVENWQPDLVALEGVQMQDKNNMEDSTLGVVTFQVLARLQGILMQALYEMKIPYIIVSPSTWRAHCGVKGKKRADKKRSMQLIAKQLYDVSMTDDCADAIGLGKYASEVGYGSGPPLHKDTVGNYIEKNTNSWE